METLKSIAPKYGLVCLVNEKPFAGVNGSGKHCNWSISTTGGENLLDPGKTPAANARFLLLLSAVLKAVDTHQDLLRLSVATADNDHRLGKDEAPPAIISVFLGEELTDILESVTSGDELSNKEREGMNIGVDVLPVIPKDMTDRNRTSPFAFTGDKFEFRMVGSSQSIAGPMFIINTIIADALKEFADRLEGAADLNAEIANIVKDTIAKHERIIFNGNSYTKEWVEIAEKRGLLNLKNTTEALPLFNSSKNTELFARHEVLSPEEIESRLELMLESYAKILRIEALTMLELANRDIVPAVLAYTMDVAGSAKAKAEFLDKKQTKLENRLLDKLGSLSTSLSESIFRLELALDREPEAGTLEIATYYGTAVTEAMGKLREVCDSLEIITDRSYWPLPSYGEILYSVK
jgi:glutamine synthetase